MSNRIRLNLWMVRETGKAMLLKDDFGHEGWVAKSQMHDLREIAGKKDKYTFEIEEWKVKDKGFVV